MSEMRQLLQWVFGIYLCITAFGGLIAKDYGLAIIVFIIGLLILPPVTQLFIKSKPKQGQKPNLNNGPDTSEIFSISTEQKSQYHDVMKLDINEEELLDYLLDAQEKKQREIKNFLYQTSHIKQSGIQLLESLGIIGTSRNIDTIKGRYRFIESFYYDLIKASYNRRYVTDMQTSIDQYKTMYYDRIPSDKQLHLLVKPNENNLSLFYCNSLNDAFQRFIEDQKANIENLKRLDAKQRRFRNIIDTADQFKSEIRDKCLRHEQSFGFMDQISETSREFHKKLHEADP